MARFAEKARDLDMKFLDRDGEPMSGDEWIEAKTDLDYLLVAIDRIENLEILTTWIGVHFDDDPGWERVIFGTQVVYLHPEDIELLDGPPLGPAELAVLVRVDPERGVNLLDIDTPAVGQLVSRYGWRRLADAEKGHKLIADDFRKRFARERQANE